MMSGAEAALNVLLGFLAALVVQDIALALAGMESTRSQDLMVVGLFTALSLVRSYVLRRVFNKIKRLHAAH